MYTTLVLASASPRRHELLGLLELPFMAFAAQVDETSRPGEEPDVLVARLSATKAAAVAQGISTSDEWASESPADLQNSLVVAADTVVVLDDEILGKPRDAVDAKQMLYRLRGVAHTVYSGITVVETSSGRATIHLSTTTVWMRDYSDAEIDAYVATGDPLDKAGAYAIQHIGFQPVARIEGCFTGVMGLPLGALVDGLAYFDITPAVDLAAVCHKRTGYPCCRRADAP
jgi:septum formation protein